MTVIAPMKTIKTTPMTKSHRATGGTPRLCGMSYSFTSAPCAMCELSPLTPQTERDAEHDGAAQREQHHHDLRDLILERRLLPFLGQRLEGEERHDQRAGAGQDP